MSPPLTTAAGVILLGPPEGNTGGEQRDQEVHMQDSLAPTEEALGASNLGTEPTLDKSSAVPEHTIDQDTQPGDQQPQDQVMKDREQEQQQDQRDEPKEQETSAQAQEQPKEKVPSGSATTPLISLPRKPVGIGRAHV